MDDERQPQAEATVSEWRSIGTVVGTTGTMDFTFVLSAWQATLGDIVAVRMEIPVPGTADRRSICVWARIVELSRFNPFFPYEAGQEIANAGVSLVETVLSGTRDQLEARGLILGAREVDRFTELSPLTYPVRPASEVFYPPAAAVKSLLIGESRQETMLGVGTLIARSDVDVRMSAGKLVSRHMAILAMTGGGKTVAARRMIRELVNCRHWLAITPYRRLVPEVSAASLICWHFSAFARYRSDRDNIKPSRFISGMRKNDLQSAKVWPTSGRKQRGLG